MFSLWGTPRSNIAITLIIESAGLAGARGRRFAARLAAAAFRSAVVIVDMCIAGIEARPSLCACMPAIPASGRDGTASSRRSAHSGISRRKPQPRSRISLLRVLVFGSFPLPPTPGGEHCSVAPPGTFEVPRSCDKRLGTTSLSDCCARLPPSGDCVVARPVSSANGDSR